MSKLFNIAILNWKALIFSVWNHKGVLVPFIRCQTRETLCPCVMPDGQWCLAGWWGQMPSSLPFSSCTTCCTLPPPQDTWQALTPKVAITLPSNLKGSLVRPFGKTHGDDWIPGDLEVILLCWRAAPLPALRRGTQLPRPARRKSQLVIQACPSSVVLVLSIYFVPNVKCLWPILSFLHCGDLHHYCQLHFAVTHGF